MARIPKKGDKLRMLVDVGSFRKDEIVTITNCEIENDNSHMFYVENSRGQGNGGWYTWRIKGINNDYTGPRCEFVSDDNDPLWFLNFENEPMKEVD